VHRDLKPANVLVTADGVVKILDFGVAKLNRRTLLTRNGATPGTVAYMSPEQIQGGEVSHLSDLWSLGVVLYEMATRVRPFRGDHEAAIMYEILNADPPPLRANRNDLPDAVMEIISRLLQKEPSRRMTSALDVAAALLGATTAPRPTASPRSIAVLYFENMSNEKENEYFCAGITDDIITDLSKIRELNIVSRTDVLPFRDRQVNTREVGAALGVGYILEGSVRRVGSRIRITAQLVEVRTGFHVWADRFDRLMEDILDLQYEVSENIVRALKISLSASEKESLARKPTDDRRAHDFYMRGREFLSRRGKRNTMSAIQMFENALALDPKYLSACSALAEAYSGLYTFYDGDAKWLGKIIGLNEKTLELDPNAVDAQFGIGVVLYHQRRMNEARAVWEKVVARQPDHYDAYRWLGIVSDVTGEHDAAIAYYTRCATLKPFSEEPWMHLDMAYRRKGDAHASHEARRKMLEVGEAKLALNPDDAITLSRLITSYQDLGDSEKARAAMKRVLEIDPTDGLALYNCACAYAQMGEDENAISYLEKAIASGYWNIKEWIKADPDFAHFRNDVRFQKVLEERR
jgi:TolB-like protein/cytochrome c-type biogenesis protein CcmH/NrfG